MLRSITLTDFQSHANSHIELGPFTVIVGSSSSGKSAVVRALRLVAENARGTSYVRQGKKVCRVAVEIAGAERVLDSSTVVTVERGKSHSQYEVRPPGMHDEPIVYTKCGQTVPDGVSDVLGFGDSGLWLAGQFDRPFLLDDTGSEVARVLGRLTNVTMIYAAVRESNRRVSESKRDQTSRQQELDDVFKSVAEYEGLPQRLTAARAAEVAVEHCEALVDRTDRLRSLVSELVDADDRLTSARSMLRSVPSTDRLVKLSRLYRLVVDAVSDLSGAESRLEDARLSRREIPDIESFDALVAQRATLKEALSLLVRVDARCAELRGLLAASREASELAQTAFADALHQSGNCPLCGASSEHARIESVL